MSLREKDNAPSTIISSAPTDGTSPLFTHKTHFQTSPASPTASATIHNPSSIAPHTAPSAPPAPGFPPNYSSGHQIPPETDDQPERLLDPHRALIAGPVPEVMTVFAHAVGGRDSDPYGHVGGEDCREDVGGIFVGGVGRTDAAAGQVLEQDG